MFRETKAFSGFSVDNLTKAKQFYKEILGLDVSEVAKMPVLNLHIVGSNNIVMYEKPNHQPATYTILNFPVVDIETAVNELKIRGVAFESYDYPGLKTDADNISRGGGPWIAWFKDPAGNILSVINM